MESNPTRAKRSSRKMQQKHHGDSATLPRRSTRRNSLQLPKGVRVLLSPRNPYEEFHKLFKGVPKEEFPINDYSCALSRDILLHGRLFASENWLCFYSNIFGFETVVKLECKKIKSITRAKTAYMFPNAILVRTEKKKYLFCSFLTRDSAHKLLSTIWQQSVTNTKTDSGVDENANGDGDDGVEEISFDGDPDEEEGSEELLVINENEMTHSEEQLRKSEDAVRVCNHRHHTISCPNTPLANHPSLKEAITTEHNEHTEHCTVHTQEKQNHRKVNRLRKYFNGIIKIILMFLQTIYSVLSSLIWLFKRFFYISDVVFLFSMMLLVVLLLTTLSLMNRISKLEQRFQQVQHLHKYNQITDQITSDQWESVLKDQEAEFLVKTERLNQVLSVILLSVENVKSNLNMIKNELNVPNDVEQSDLLDKKLSDLAKR